MDFNKIGNKSLEFLHQLSEQIEKFEELSLNYIKELEGKNLKIPEFEDSFDWINTDGKLSFSTTLSNKLCVLDFFTYCCINCMHVLPDLHELEQKYTIEDGVAVIGVHSAKFQNEKLLTNILNAVLRYDITHPVVNDADAVFWNKLNIQCWPTFVIVSPEGKILLYLVGEGHKAVLFKFVEVALKYYKDGGLIKNHNLPIKLAKDSLTNHALHFPGKIALSENGQRIAISNTGYHQILIATNTGLLHDKVGAGTPGLKDGNFSECKFNAPQGLTWDGNSLYVADTENHVIRKIDIDAKTVIAITGTGKQGNDKEGGKEGVKQEISSPWDVLVSSPPGSEGSSIDDRSCLYIAQAGTHQIWCYFLSDGSWLKKSSQKKNTCLRFAGSGNEENRNNSYPHKASFAQPSGLTMATIKEQNHLYIADSESSSVRSIETKTGAVKACVGGERDPTNLFGFGDIDGKGYDAKLQHPLAVAFNATNGLLYVADSYNHKLKTVDPITKLCTTLCGTGVAGFKDGSFDECQFNEPGDVKVSNDGQFVYVADTNNHRIRLLDLQKKTVTSLSVSVSDQVDSIEKLHIAGTKQLVNRSKAQRVKKDVAARSLTEGRKLNVELKFDKGLHLNKEAESKYQCSITKEASKELVLSDTGMIKEDSYIMVVLPVVTGNIMADVELLLYICSEDETCYMKQYVIEQVIQDNPEASSEDVSLSHEVTL